MAAYHKSNLGKFGEQLITDVDGYTYTTAEEWLTARIDGGLPQETEADREYAQEWSKEQADKARKAITAAEQSVAVWRSRQ